MKKIKFLITLILVVMMALLNGCTKEEKPTYDIAGKTFYNTVDEYGNAEHSNVWFGKDGSFVLKDNYFDGYYQIVGDWSIKENVVTLDVKESGVGQFSKIIFEIEDNETLKLKTTLAGSKAEDVFSINQNAGSGPSGSDEVKFTYTVYYNISQTSKQKSTVELRSDKSFAFVDKNDFGIVEYNGTYTQDKDKLTLTANEDGRKIEFKIVDEKNLLLQNDVGVSATGDKFTSDYKEGGESTAKDVPCTAITSLYNNYWAVEGVSNYDLEVKVTPENTTDTITYTSDDENVVKVDEKGLCKAISPGTTKIHIKCGSIERVVGFETRAKSVAVTGVSLDQDKVTIMFNGTGKINAKVAPDNATDKTLTYKSSDSDIVKVDGSGNLTGVGPGVAKVTVSAANGKQAECEVCVEGETVIFKMENNVSLKAGSGEKIPYQATWIMCYDFNYNKQDVTKEVDFHTAYTSALDIDGSGNVYAKGAIYETVDITVYFTFSDGSSFNVRSQDFVVHVEK